MDAFIDLAARGKGGFLRYALSLALVLFMWLAVGSVPLALVVLINRGMPFEWQGEPAVPGPLSGIDPVLTFYVPVAFSFIALAAGLFASVRYIHGRPLLSLITPAAGINYGRVLTGFLIFLAFNVVGNVVSYLIEPSSFALSLEPWRLLVFAPIYLLLTAIQTTTEEMLFRGYLLQGLGRAVGRPAFAAFLSSILFMLVHLGNPEMSNGFLLAAAYYFCVGLWLSLVTVRDGTSELAIGAHAANNMFILIVNYKSSALELVPSVFKMTQAGPADMALSLGLFIVMSAAAYILLFSGNKKRIRQGAPAASSGQAPAASRPPGRK
ncbi:CPBP family intramembrane metalloprotease [Candidatus Micrarchaeota archaeon]|nr:CPBP family intramembrane metalloprotease [Candidatus Micrarchaeota archaeon]